MCVCVFVCVCVSVFVWYNNHPIITDFSLSHTSSVSSSSHVLSYRVLNIPIYNAVFTPGQWNNNHLCYYIFRTTVRVSEWSEFRDPHPSNSRNLDSSIKIAKLGMVCAEKPFSDVHGRGIGDTRNIKEKYKMNKQINRNRNNYSPVMRNVHFLFSLTFGKE